MKKVLSIIIIISIIVSNTIPLRAYAEGPASNSATPIASSLNPLPFDSSSDDSTDTFKQQALMESAIKSLTKNPEPGLSVNKALPVKVRGLMKKTFRSSEKVPLTIDNDRADKVIVEVFNVDGEKVDATIETINTSEPAILTIAPPRHFKPGRYRLKVTDSTGVVTTQDFTWGVLAINTNKSIYQQNDIARIHIAVLNETGNMVCDAKVKLLIKDPGGKILEHSTDTGSIKVNPECNKKEFTMEPDFEAHYSVLGGEGIYEMTLTAVTKNGTYTITDNFQAKQDVLFDIERIANTRIFPPLPYPVLLSITANQDFNGEVSEVVPDNFKIGNIENLPSFSVATKAAELEGATTTTHLDLPFLGNYEITQGFGVEETDPLMAEKYKKYGLVGHDGMDFALSSSTPVLATDDGVIVRAEDNGDYGTTVIVSHSWGKSYYGHLSKITKNQGDIVKKGEEIGLSGNTGLSTGPHLHFGIKLNNNDSDNGYYGKTNPLPYFTASLSEVAGIATPSATLRNDTGNGVQILTWNINVKKGDKIKLGYNYLAPPKSPQFYTLGPLEFISSPINNEAMKQSNNGILIFKESRKWQIAVDADGSGTMTVTPTKGLPLQTGKTYTFTFTPAETMNSGTIQIQVPSSVGWTAPNQVQFTAGYTTAVGNNNALLGDILDNAEFTPWIADDADMCTTLSIDTTTFVEGTGSILCDNNPTSAGPDSGDGFGFDAEPGFPWSWAAYTKVGYWINRTGGTSGTNAEFAWSNTTDLNGGRIAGCAVPATPSSGVWVYSVCTLSGTLTTINSYGFRCTAATCDPFETGDVYVDDFLIGPPAYSGTQTSGNNITVRLIEATSSDSVTITYGSGAGAGVTNSWQEGVHTFTTLTKTASTGTLTAIASSPTVTFPTKAQLLRHGTWFFENAEEPFTF